MLRCGRAGGFQRSCGSCCCLIGKVVGARDWKSPNGHCGSGTETRGFLEPTAFAGMLRANPQTIQAADRSAAAVRTVELQPASQEIVRDSSAEFRLHLDEQPALVRLTAEVWHPGTATAPQIIVNGNAVADMQFSWPSLRERNYVAFLWDGDEQVQAAFDYQGWLQGTAFVEGRRWQLGDNVVAIEVVTDQIKVRNVKAEVLTGFDAEDTIYDLRRETRDQPNPLLPADK